MSDPEDRKIGTRLLVAGIVIGFAGIVALGTVFRTPSIVVIAGGALVGAMFGAAILLAYGILRVFTD